MISESYTLLVPSHRERVQLSPGYVIRHNIACAAMADLVKSSHKLKEKSR